MDELSKKRLLKGTSYEAEPLKVLKLAIENIEDKDIEPTGLILILVNKNNHTRSVYRAGMTWEEQVAYLQLESADVITSKMSKFNAVD